MVSSACKRNSSPAPAAAESLDMVGAAQRAVMAAAEAHEAASQHAQTPQAVLFLTAKALVESRVALDLVEATAEATPTRRGTQSFTEFTSMLGEQAQGMAQGAADQASRYAERNIRKAKSLIEDHFLVDEAFRMLGPLRQDSNRARDIHDVFNLLALLPVICLNFKNWQIACPMCRNGTHLPDLWHGEAFELFWWLTILYFIADVLFVSLLPQCVKSPRVILYHHVATIGYILIPKIRPEFGWLMGACMIVEVNTWFLVARRYFNKLGDTMFTEGVSLSKSCRLLFVSSCFYVTWFAVRLFFYPYLFYVIIGEWLKYSWRVGAYLNLIAVAPVMQAVFIYLNVKWSIDLLRSKLKGRGPSKGL